MATTEEIREQRNGLILGLVLVVIVAAVCWMSSYCARQCDYEPELAPPAGEHSMLEDET